MTEDHHHHRRDRAVFRSFFYVTAASYAGLAIATLDNATFDLWPGNGVWAALYLTAAVATLIVGITIRSVGSRLSVGLRQAGLIVTPVLLTFRAAVSFVGLWPHGWLGAIFLLWAAFVVSWAAYLTRYLPATEDEWVEVRDQIAEIRETLRRQREGRA